MVIVGGGPVTIGLLTDLAGAGAAIVAADGGAAACARAGVLPVAIIGDMDSLDGREGWAGRTQLIEIEEQDTTDFEKCLYSTKAPLTIALGMTGGRFDHTMAALDLVARHGVGRRIILIDGDDLALAVSGPFRFCVAPGERVSVHALVAVTFAKSEGLAYGLDGLELGPGIRTGTSNHAVDGPFSITPGRKEMGVWLLILDRCHLRALIDALVSKNGGTGLTGEPAVRNPI